MQNHCKTMLIAQHNTIEAAPISKSFLYVHVAARAVHSTEAKNCLCHFPAVQPTEDRLKARVR